MCIRDRVRVDTKVRHYVDKLQEKIGKDNINLGEKDGESLAAVSYTHLDVYKRQAHKRLPVSCIQPSGFFGQIR